MKKKKVLISCYDAGAAEILSSWINHNKPDAVVVIDGPAKKIFHKKCSNVTYSSLDKALIESDWVLCGSGWSSPSNFELNTIDKAKKLKKKQ